MMMISYSLYTYGQKLFTIKYKFIV